MKTKNGKRVVTKLSLIMDMLDIGMPVNEIAKTAKTTPGYVNFVRSRMRNALKDAAGAVKPKGSTNTRTSILDDAKEIIYGDREKTYGAPDKNLNRIAALWSAYAGVNFNANDVCLMMVLLKAARLINDPTHRDSLTDMCGYAALMERIQK